MSEALFNHLFVGLEKYERQSPQKYPYPVELGFAMNELALRLKDNYPKSFPAFLAMLEKPIGEWYANGEVPKPLDAEVTILYKGKLDEIVEEYLEENDLRGISNPGEISSRQENLLMKQLITTARDQYAQASDEEAASIEKAYADGRAFLIQNPFATWQKLRQSFRFNRFAEQFEQMYQKAETAQHLARKGYGFLSCRECGPLQLSKNDEAISLRPKACNGRCPSSTGWQIQEDNPELYVLKQAIHSRTMIPGRAEIVLYQALQKLQAKDVLHEIRLYPAIDQYDLQLRFEYLDKDENKQLTVWAVDVKDYTSPQQLGKKISEKLNLGIHHAFPKFRASLEWHRAFYVVPDSREEAQKGYCNTLRVAIDSHKYSELEVLTVSEFLERVRQFIWEKSNV